MLFCTKSAWPFIGRFGLCVKFAQSSSQWEKGLIPEEMSQTLLTNKKQGNLDQVHNDNIIKPTQTRIDRVPLFRPRTDPACHKKQNPSRETVPFKVGQILRFIHVS